MNVDRELDVRGLNCPTLGAAATDPGSLRDFQALARQTGHELLEQSHDNQEFVHLLRKK